MYKRLGRKDKTQIMSCRLISQPSTIVQYSDIVITYTRIIVESIISIADAFTYSITF